jgi:hypothetical protein
MRRAGRDVLQRRCRSGAAWVRDGGEQGDRVQGCYRGAAVRGEGSRYPFPAGVLQAESGYLRGRAGELPGEQADGGAGAAVCHEAGRCRETSGSRLAAQRDSGSDGGAEESADRSDSRGCQGAVSQRARSAGTRLHSPCDREFRGRPESGVRDHTAQGCENPFPAVQYGVGWAGAVRWCGQSGTEGAWWVCDIVSVGAGVAPDNWLDMLERFVHTRTTKEAGGRSSRASTSEMWSRNSRLMRRPTAPDTTT